MVADPVVFRDLAYVFVAAVLGAILARLARQPLILGYVAAGVVMSPLGLFLGAVAGYGLTFAVLLAAAFLIDLTAGVFGGTRDRVRALST